MSATFNAVILSELSAVKPVINEALSFVHSFFPELSHEEKFEFKLILSELIVNAIVHGNDSDPGKKVSLRVSVDEGLIEAVIADEGSGFDYLGYFKNMTCDTLQASGRGLLIASRLARLEFNDCGNSVMFCRKVGLNV